LVEILFDETNTRLQIEAESWEAVVGIGGELLVGQGCVEDSYIDGMIQNVSKHRVDVVIAEGIAVPHTRYEDGAFRAGISLVTLKMPLSFARSQEMVKVVLCFSAMNVQDYRHMVSFAFDLIEYGVLDRLAEAKTLGEVRSIVALC
jgi:PTS system ascorbate-specific IIA component